jgi:membrane-bound lytic murein transglycosylase D
MEKTACYPLKEMISQDARKRAIGRIAATAFALAAAVSPACADAIVAQNAANVSVPGARSGPQRSGPEPGPGSGPWGAAGPPAQGHAAWASYGIPMPWGEEHFEAFRAAYLTDDGKKWLAAIMTRAKPFLAYIEERVRFYGLPDELAFLPVVESEFSPRNISKSGAAGLWQFMRNSIAGYGMRVDDWVDERRDFMKSTDGALRKLADNYAAFGDWNLALAAYNCGDGAIARLVAKAKKAGVDPVDYWELRKRGLLKSETASYVPKFLAVASILRYPGRNGLALDWDEPAEWATVEPGRPVDLKLLSDQAGIPLPVLREANPELRYGVTPPSRGYLLKVPQSAVDAVRTVVNDPSRKLVRYYLHTVRSGDTLSEIARRYGAPMPAIVDSNPGLKPDRIMLGQVVVVPALKDAPPPEPEAATGDVPDFVGTYIVAKGDTLWSISLRYEVQPELLAERNGLGLSSVIHEGMNLRVPMLKSTS